LLLALLLGLSGVRSWRLAVSSFDRMPLLLALRLGLSGEPD
jgi:hypothetical protein